jgi:protein TonB
METIPARMYRGLRLRAALSGGHGSLMATVPASSAAAWSPICAPSFEKRRLALLVIAALVLLLHALAALELVQHVPQTTPRVERDPLTVEFALAPATAPAQVAPTPGRDTTKHQTATPAHAETARQPAPHVRSTRGIVIPRQPATPSHTPPVTNTVQAPVDTPLVRPATSAPTGPTESTGEQQTAVPLAPSAEQAPQPLTPASFAAAYLHNPAPDYPAQALERGWQGTVLLRAHVLSAGRADQVEVVTSSGHDVLDDAAVEAVSNWRFVPARRGDTAVDTWVRIPVNFKQ